MAYTTFGGTLVQDMYQDFVQLGNSGNGTPGTTGGEAALYDGSGKRIISRLAQRDWRDVCPAAAVANSGSPYAETFEFSATGNMTQGQLESAGWSFTNCTGSVTSGQLVCVVTTAFVPCHAELTLGTALSGDFDIQFCPMIPRHGDVPAQNGYGGLQLCDPTANTLQSIHYQYSNGVHVVYCVKDGVYSTSAMGTSMGYHRIYDFMIARLSRASGTMSWSCSTVEGLTGNSAPWVAFTYSTSDSFTKLRVVPHSAPTGNGIGWVFGCRFIRRYV